MRSSFVAVIFCAFLSLLLVLAYLLITNNSVIFLSRENCNGPRVGDLISFSPVAEYLDLPTIFFITPTYKRRTQKVDLTKLCQTLQLVDNIIWIVVEDSPSFTEVVNHTLADCDQVHSVHLNVTSIYTGKGHRGVQQRNLGLQWIRKNYRPRTTKGVVYFGDDDNTYDTRLFEEMRYTKKVSVWPVGFAGGLPYEGPECSKGAVTGWIVDWAPDREFPIDMAAFAVNLDLLLKKPVSFSLNAHPGTLESNFLSGLGITVSDLEAKADSCTKIYVWHTKTVNPQYVASVSRELEVR